MIYPSFRDPRSLQVLPKHFPYGLTPWQELYGWRLSLPKKAKTDLLVKALRHPDLYRHPRYTPTYLGGVRAAIRYELARRGR